MTLRLPGALSPLLQWRPLQAEMPAEFLPRTTLLPPVHAQRGGEGTWSTGAPASGWGASRVVLSYLWLSARETSEGEYLRLFYLPCLPSRQISGSRGGEPSFCHRQYPISCITCFLHVHCWGLSFQALLSKKKESTYNHLQMLGASVAAEASSSPRVGQGSVVHVTEHGWSLWLRLWLWHRETAHVLALWRGWLHR